MKAISGMPGWSCVRLLHITILIVHLLLLALSGHAQLLKPKAGLIPAASFPDAEIKRVKAIYTAQIGVREQPGNSGLEVEAYLRYVNLPKGNPWCAAFVCWTLGQAGLANPRTGWSPRLFPVNQVIWQSALKSGRVSGAREGPRSADVFGLYFPEKGRIAHVGFVDEWQDPWLITVEGNTNVLGSREGDGVYRKRRLVRSVYRVARYVK